MGSRSWRSAVFTIGDVAEVTFEGVVVADLPLQDPDAIEGEWVGGTLTTAGGRATWLAGWCTSLGTVDG